MAVAVETYPHLVKPENGSAYLKRVPRMRVATIVANYLAHGYSPDEIARLFPHVSVVEAHMAMAYYYDHQQEVENEINAELAEIEGWESNGHVSPFFLRMKSKGILQ